MTKSICFIFAAGLALAAVASAEITEEESFAEATSFVQSFMTEDAQGDSACLKVATDAIAVIQTECDGMQKTVDAAAKANQKCCESGKAAVCKAAASQTTLSGKSADCDKQADKIQNAQITVTTHTSLAARTGGKCDAIDDSSAYKTKRAEYKKKSSECSELKGASNESKKALAAAVSDAAAKRSTCNNNAESALASAFKIAEGTCNSEQNQKSYKRAMHMKCVLNGTPLAECNTGKAPSVTKTNLSALNCKAITSKTSCGTDLVMKTQYNEVQAIVYKGGATTLTWGVHHSICSSAGKKTPGSSNWHGNQYCAYNSNYWKVTARCNWGGQKFDYVRGTMKKHSKGYMCAHRYCDHVVTIQAHGGIYTSSGGGAGKVTLQTGDSVFCGM